jgi:hypothetical protein
MSSFKNTMLAVCALTAVAGAQSFDATYPGTFLDISTGLGTAITGVGDDTGHSITTTLGNPLFPAGAVRVCSNGTLSAGATAGATAFTNVTINPTGVPAGLPAGASAHLCPHWDDLYCLTNTNTSIYWYEDLTNSILYVQWNNVEHFAGVAGEVITFQVQVFGLAAGPCVPHVQYLYADTTFGGSAAPNHNGASATIGYVNGTIAGAANALYSFNTASIYAGLVLTMIANPPYSLTATSPGGAGDLQLDFSNGPCAGGTYFMAVTLVGGLYPNGWFYGLDVPISELVGLYSLGFPFVGPLPIGGGTFSLGPFGAGALPSGFQFWAVAVGWATGGNGSPTTATPAITYVIP